MPNGTWRGVLNNTRGEDAVGAPVSTDFNARTGTVSTLRTTNFILSTPTPQEKCYERASDPICHASTSAVREVAFPVDEPIDPQGQAKAAALAGALRRVDAASTSPALRAKQTAAALQLEATVDAALQGC